ncbi:hypothetical protein GGI42DRAFT_344470 [Trichoderma sp. SZMC 28013]
MANILPHGANRDAIPEILQPSSDCSRLETCSQTWSWHLARGILSLGQGHGSCLHLRLLPAVTYNLCRNLDHIDTPDAKAASLLNSRGPYIPSHIPHARARRPLCTAHNRPPFRPLRKPFGRYTPRRGPPYEIPVHCPCQSHFFTLHPHTLERRNRPRSGLGCYSY